MRRTVVLGVVALALAALFVRLGFWQLDRAAERKAANAEIRRKLAQPPVTLNAKLLSDPCAAERLRYRRVEAAGRYDPAREIVLKRRAWQGSPGVELLTPLALDGGGEIWVNRGWVPSPDAATVDRTVYAERGPVRITGFVQPPTVRSSPGVPAPGLVVEQLRDPSLPQFPVRRRGPELDSGPHMSYAIQWFAFAAIALVGYGAYLRSRGRGGTEPRRSGPWSADA